MPHATAEDAQHTAAETPHQPSIIVSTATSVTPMSNGATHTADPVSENPPDGDSHIHSITSSSQVGALGRVPVSDTGTQSDATSSDLHRFGAWATGGQRAPEGTTDQGSDPTNDGRT